VSAAGQGRRRRVLAVLAVLLLLAALATAGAYQWLTREFKEPGPAQSDSEIEVPPGTSLRSVLTRLQSGGAIDSARAVQWYLRLSGRAPRVQAGRYELPSRASPEQIITLFEEGKVILEQITVVEGATFADFFRSARSTAAPGAHLKG